MKKQSILAGSGILFIASSLSAVLGFVRDKMIGYYWGSSPHSDAFWAAFMVPDLLYYLLSGGALSASIIPVLTGYVLRGEREDTWQMANTLFTLFWLAAMVGAAVVIVFAGPLVLLVAPGFPPDKAAECAGYVRILAPAVMFTVASALSTAVLQSHRHFTAPALSWLFYNFGIIGGAVIGGHWIGRHLAGARGVAATGAGLNCAAMGVVVGAVLLVTMQTPALRARGFRLRAALNLSHPGVQEALRLFPPYMITLAATQICLLWVPNLLGSYFPNGVTSLRYSNRLAILPYSQFAFAIAIAAFPAMSERVQEGDFAGLRKLVSGTLRAVFLLIVPAGVALVTTAGPILRLLFKGGSMDEMAIDRSAFCLIYFTGSVVGLSGLQIANRAFFSLRDRVTPLLVALGYNILIIVLAIALMHTTLQYAGIAAGVSLGTMVGLMVMMVLLRRRLGGIDGRTLAASLVRIALASCVMGAVVLLVVRATGQFLHLPASVQGTYYSLTAPAPVANIPSPAHAVLVQVVLSLGAGVAAYLGMLALLGAEELGIALSTVRRRFRAKAPVAAS